MVECRWGSGVLPSPCGVPPLLTAAGGGNARGPQQQAGTPAAPGVPSVAPAARDTTSRRTQSRVSQLSTYRAIYICACISVSVSVSVPFPLSFFHEIALEIPDQEDAHIWQHATDPDHIGFRVPDADAPLRPLHQST